MQLNHPIALGATADIFAWQAGQVLKLFHEGRSRSSVEYEANLTRSVHAAGMPVPAVGAIIEIDGRFGLELERVEGISMLEAMIRRPWQIFRFARLLAELQADMHQKSLPEPPSMRERLRHKINGAEKLPEVVRRAALDALERLREDDKLCHGDFHPGNILLTTRGPVIIDWIDVTRGAPVMDMARSSLLIKDGPIPPGTPGARLLKILRGWFYNIYLHRYIQLTSMDKLQLSRWIPVAAAARLDENITADEERLLSIAKNLISKG